VYPSRLRISPPRPGDLEHWRDLTELRELTRSEAAGSKGSRAHAAPSWDTPGTATSTTAFLRWRVLPAGPWEFSRTFPLRFPRPADWGRDPVGAGEPGLRVKSRIFRSIVPKATRKPKPGLASSYTSSCSAYRR